MASGTVLITGCATGIGEATARAFNESGWEVYATDPDPEALSDLEELGCTTAELDVTAEGDAQRVVDELIDERGRVDCLYNNAGYGQIGPVEEVPTDRLREQLEVNFFGQHRLLRAVLPHMRERGEGTVVNMASVYGRTVFPGQGAYASSKWAVEALTDTLRVEVDDYGIDVVTVEPGPVETQFGERALATKDHLEPTDDYEWFYRIYDENRYDRRFLDRGPAYVQPERVAEVVLEAAESDDPERRYVVGPWKALVYLGYVVPGSVRDRVFGALKRLL
jgi:NAD(P)-dependent dehydrogenase (short-subunit alcohol dehydrogenase family)